MQYDLVRGGIEGFYVFSAIARSIGNEGPIALVPNEIVENLFCLGPSLLVPSLGQVATLIHDH